VVIACTRESERVRVRVGGRERLGLGGAQQGERATGGLRAGVGEKFQRFIASSSECVLRVEAKPPLAHSVGEQQEEQQEERDRRDR